jgi:hypothetical protein
MLSILGWTFIVDPVDSGPVTTSPVAGIAYTLDVAWGPGPGDAAAAYATTLSCPGATDDTTYGATYAMVGTQWPGHRVTVPGAVGIDQGWSPDGELVWLDPGWNQCALAFWRLTFPSTGSYTVTLAGIGTIPVTVASAAPAPTVPTWTLLHAMPMGRGPAKVGLLSFNGTYPAGGLDVNDALVGLGGIFFADIVFDGTYSYSWSANKLHVYNTSGEVAGGSALQFATSALFIGGGI